MRDPYPLVCRCEDCGLRYPESSLGIPITSRSYTCDDCGGYVMDARETRQWERESDQEAPNG